MFMEARRLKNGADWCALRQLSIRCEGLANLDSGPNDTVRLLVNAGKGGQGARAGRPVSCKAEMTRP